MVRRKHYLEMKLVRCVLDYKYEYQGSCGCGAPDVRVYSPINGDKPADRMRRYCRTCALLWERWAGHHGEEEQAAAEAQLKRERRAI